MSVYVSYRRPVPTFGMFMLASSLLLMLGALLPRASLPSGKLTSTLAAPELAQLPLHFVPNVGQTDPAVRFQAQSLGGSVFFTANKIVLSLPQREPRTENQEPQGVVTHAPHSSALGSTVVRVQFDNANRAPVITGADILSGRINYLQGDDPAQWRTDVPTYAGVVYHNLYAGIDLHYDGHGGTLKGTYIVAPGVDPAQIRWRYRGVENVQVDGASGDLQITVAGDQSMTEAAPVAWQVIDGQRVPVDVRYHVADDQGISFVVGQYNAALPLIIDPTLEYGTYLGGEGNDPALDIAVDGTGNIYLTGLTNSPNFPTKNAVDATFNRLEDAYVAKISADGRTLLYSTYLGGSHIDNGSGIAVDGVGNAYISGVTFSSDFPTTPGAFDRTRGDGQPCQVDCADDFVAKLNAQGNALVYASYLGGSDAEIGIVGPSIAVDGAGNAYLTGITSSSDFPTTPGAFDRTLAIDPFSQVGNDAFITKVNAQGSALVYSTLLGGTDIDEAKDIAVDGAGNAYIMGETGEDFPIKNAAQSKFGGVGDTFITKLNTAGSDLVFSTYLGGNDYDFQGSIAVDGAGNTYVSGHTFSKDFPVKNALQPACKRCDPTSDGFDAYVAKLSAAGNTLVYSTYLGGTAGEDAFGLAVDGAGHAYVAGTTASSDFPTKNPLQGDAPAIDSYVAKLSVDGRSLVYATYLGGSDGDLSRGLALDPAGNVYVAGETFSTDFPTKNALQPKIAGFSDAYVVKLSDRVGRPQVYLPLVQR